MKIKTIKIYDENKEINYEGQILISEDGSFEGIVSNPFDDMINSYIVGKYKSLTGKLTFNVVRPEWYPDDVLGYSLIKGFRKDEYIGESTDGDGDNRLCCAKIERIIADKDVKKAQLIELKAMVENYRDTYEERFHFASKSYYELTDEQKSKVEIKYKKKKGIYV